jgi:uncharacterized protein YegJ (DUF2314 family)
VVCQAIVERGQLDRPGTLTVDINTLRYGGYREATLAKGGVGKVTVELAVAEPKEGDADNRLIEIGFPGPANQLAERQVAAIVQLWGKNDEVLGAKHGDEVLAAASERARARLLTELKPSYQPKPPERHELAVKAPFTTPDGGGEFMWVEVVRWEGTTIHGLLMNNPTHIPGLHQGASDEVAEASVIDYQLTLPDGTQQVNETTEILLRQHAR